MSLEYGLGIVVGIVCALIVIFLLCRAFKVRRVKPQYDERQIAAQGKAFKLAFFTLAGWCALYGMLDSFGVRWCESAGTGLFLGIFVSIGVYAVTAVCKDAYFGYNESVSSARLLAILGAMNLVSALGVSFEGERIIEDGLVQSSPTISYFIALLFAVLLIVNKVHGKKASGEEETE